MRTKKVMYCAKLIDAMFSSTFNKESIFMYKFFREQIDHLTLRIHISNKAAIHIKKAIIRQNHFTIGH